MASSSTQPARKATIIEAPKFVEPMLLAAYEAVKL